MFILIEFLHILIGSSVNNIYYKLLFIFSKMEPSEGDFHCNILYYHRRRNAEVIVIKFNKFEYNLVKLRVLQRPVYYFFAMAQTFHKLCQEHLKHQNSVNINKINNVSRLTNIQASKHI